DTDRAAALPGRRGAEGVTMENARPSLKLLKFPGNDDHRSEARRLAGRLVELEPADRELLDHLAQTIAALRAGAAERQPEVAAWLVQDLSVSTVLHLREAMGGRKQAS